ncbi:hypothetical protein OsI_20187 [Oryza sativa Indica Group]|uniref:Myb-like domain-containing protein n=1 Tax=Oryza sativa subsp. indica TaxID=39946 RepID=B8AYT6_ORYSI|nr:hypothetical protein OsI_20187 [Oryza sativa Indica Group]
MMHEAKIKESDMCRGRSNRHIEHHYLPYGREAEQGPAGAASSSHRGGGGGIVLAGGYGGAAGFWVEKPLRLETTTIRRHHLRKNNEHWTLKEITELVKGVSKNGVGSWTKLKRDFFSTSIRTAVHLKDKWRNLLKACGIKFTSKRKVAVHALHL